MTASARSRRAGDLVAEELLDAALVEFAAHGFDGATTRAIAARAGWHQPQINYHYSSKEQLWRASVDRLFEQLALAMVDGAHAGGGRDPAEDFAELVRRFVAFSARRPELHRIMNLEATVDSERLAWLVERHVAGLYGQLAAAWERVRRAGEGAELEARQVFEVLIGVGAHPFANEPLLTRLTGVSVTDEAPVAQRTELLVRLLLPTD